MWRLVCITAGAIACAGVLVANDRSFSSDFSDPAGWHVASYDFSHPSFATDWRADQVSFGAGLTLRLRPHTMGRNPFVSGSVRRVEPTGYGRYEAKFRAAKGAGLVTGFFTYTGPAYGTRHDEIDVEILGKNTRNVQIGWFVDGKHYAQTVDLGFDAADATHLYAFNWTAQRIEWFVDGRLIAQSDFANAPVPSVPSRSFANLWAAAKPASEWAGTIAPQLSAEAYFEFMRFTPNQSETTVATETSLRSADQS